MPPTKPLPATDSAAELNKIIGDDATATFESDPEFIDSDPTESASSENLEEQRPGAGQEFSDSMPPLKAKTVADDDEDDEEEDDDDDEEDEDDEEDDDLEDDDDDDEFEDDDDEDDDEDEDEEDDADELEASASPTLLMDGLLGYEDEADDVEKGRTRAQGDAARARSRNNESDADDDGGDVSLGVDEDALNHEETDTEIVIRPRHEVPTSERAAA